MTAASSIPYTVRRSIIEFANKETARLIWNANCQVTKEVETIIKNALILGCVEGYKMQRT